MTEYSPKTLPLYFHTLQIYMLNKSVVRTRLQIVIEHLVPESLCFFTLHKHHEILMLLEVK